MRRSSAPSQLSGNAAKKFKFIPPRSGGPGSATASLPATSEVTHENVNNESSSLQSKALVAKYKLVQGCPLYQTTGSLDEGVCLKRSESDHSNAMPTLSAEPASTSQADVDPQQQQKPSRFFAVPKQIRTSLPLVSHQTNPENLDNEQNISFITYYSVLWCKASKKKHKKWEGDAVLIVRKTSVVLKDMEGKDIGKGTGYKPKELKTLSEGQTLMIGGKEVEITGPISAEDFMSDALVMPRPNLSHQWLFNKAGLPLVDIVVDPYLAIHLRPHQCDGVIFLYECIMGMRTTGRFGAILADEMGLGKTLQCITLIWTLMRQGPYGSKPIIKKTLVVTPGSLVKNWVSEFQKWLGMERLKVFAVDQDHKVEDFINSPLYSVLIISYEMLLRCLEQIQNFEFNLIICDEGHRLKNSSIKTSTAILSLSCDRRVILTGTPIQNDLQEFYSLIEFVNPGIIGSSSTYRKIYEEPIIRSKQPSATIDEKQLGEERATELCRLTGFFILRRTQDIINNYLPPKTEWIVFCRPAVLQLEFYQKLLASHAVKSCLQGSLENSSHLICIGLLKKLCNHPALFFNSIKGKEILCNTTDFDHQLKSSPYDDLAGMLPVNYEPPAFTEKDSGKLQVLIDLLASIHEQNSAERVVLVSNYTQTLDILQEMCKRFGYSYTRLDGQTAVSQRQKLVDSFNSKHGQSFIFLLSSKAGGVGLNLIGASRLVLYDIDWNPANDVQAMARVWRDGQKRPVHIYRLLTTGTIEEKIYQRQVSKQSLSGTVVDLKKKSEHASFSLEELRNLFQLEEDSNCLTHDLLYCKCLGNGQPIVNLTAKKAATPRPCQLGHNSEMSDSHKHLSMSDLMDWKHFSGETQHFPDPVLEKAKENITFMFQNTTKPQAISS
ncbi:DNA repair and recombination protein RAD54B isoform X2 [Stegostoma tigrinum]|uniref:DNA repair and recombination protein RAD54B isoform X2 n=1 Tax=Stegostoma tigrinum TaxID=3053191 RepID=UPI0028707907|nr:DNA repair and recombination protein RAD54B isoform X2 [Stegostoma tigrinum]